MESEEVYALRKALELEKAKQQELQTRLDAQAASRTTMRSVTVERPAFHSFVEREEENIMNLVQKSLRNLVQEKVDLESLLEQEQEYIINAMSREVAQALTEKLYRLCRELKKRLESRNRSTSISDVDSNSVREGSVTDSSFSSDSESGREPSSRQKVKLLEAKLACIKQQVRMAKLELRQYKKQRGEMDAVSVEAQRGTDTDRSDASSNRSFCLDTSQELVKKANS